MHVGLAFDAQYAEYAAVTIDSVLDHNEGTNIWVVAPSAPGRLKEVVNRAVDGRADVNFLEPPTEWCDFALPQQAGLSYLSAGMYYRLAFPDLLPDDVERLLYVDSDTMCMATLSPLRALQLEGRPIAAVRNAINTHWRHDGGIPGYEAAWPERAYFNSGVLLIDLFRWREERLGERAATYVRQQASRLRYPDQDALNVAVDGRWLELDESWNFKVRDEMDPSHVLSALQPLPRIVHFSGTWKPWSSTHLEGDVKREYLRRAKRLGFSFGR